MNKSHLELQNLGTRDPGQNDMLHPPVQALQQHEQSQREQRQQQRQQWDDGSAGSTPADAEANIFLRLRDARLEREFWRHESDIWWTYDVVSCLFSITLQVVFANLGAAPAGEPGPAALQAAVRLPHQLMLLASLTQLAAMLLAWGAYCRARVRALVALKVARVAMHVWQTILSPDTAEWWRGHIVSQGKDPARAVGIAIAAVPLALLQHAVMHPCPAALFPLFSAATVWVYLAGFLEGSVALWEHPKLAGAAAAACGRLRVWMSIAGSASEAVFGTPPFFSASHWEASPQGCSCLLQTASVSLMLLTAIALPGYLCWTTEHRMKRRWLLSRGAELRVRIPALSRLRRRGAGQGTDWWMAGPVALAGAPLLALQLGELLVWVRSPDCRLVAAGAAGS